MHYRPVGRLVGGRWSLHISYFGMSSQPERGRTSRIVSPRTRGFREGAAAAEIVTRVHIFSTPGTREHANPQLKSDSRQLNLY